MQKNAHHIRWFELVTFILLFFSSLMHLRCGEWICRNINIFSNSRPKFCWFMFWGLFSPSETNEKDTKIQLFLSKSQLESNFLYWDWKVKYFSTIFGEKWSIFKTETSEHQWRISYTSIIFTLMLFSFNQYHQTCLE